MIAAIEKEEKLYTFEEYCEFEEKSNLKYEFHNGKIIPMPITISGGTINHADITGNLYFYLRSAIKKLSKNVSIHNSEKKVFIKVINEGLYPDLSIIVGNTEYYKKNKAITNPTIIFEVLSDSTAGYDRGNKFKKYQNLPSFQEYVLIDQDQPVIDVLHKKENGKWKMDTFIGLKDTLILSSLNIEIPLADIYEDVTDDLILPQFKIDLE